MNDPALMTVELLTSLGFGTLGGGNAFDLYVGQPPDKPDACVVVNLAGGLAPYDRLLLNQPSVQVMVRGAPSGYVAASNKIYAIVNALLGMSSQTLSGDVYRACNQIGDVSTLGQDINTRPILVANFRFIVEPAAVSGGHRVPIN